MRKLIGCTLTLAAALHTFAQPVELKLRVIDADTDTRRKDTNFVLAATSGFSVVQSLGTYYLFGSYISTSAWRSDGINFWDLRFPPNLPHADWPDRDKRCDPNLHPTLRDPRCGDSSHVVWKQVNSTAPRWNYFNSITGTTATLPQFPAVGSWPYQFPGDFPKTGIPGQQPTINAAKINAAVPNPVPAAAAHLNCTRDRFGYLATGAANTKVVSVASNKWYMGFNETINNPNAAGGWTEADQFNIGWATSTDGKQWSVKKILFRTVRERTKCNGGLLLTQLFIDGNYFYMVVNELDNGTILLRAQINTTNADGYNVWQIATHDPANPNRYLWVNTPADGMLDTSASGLNAYLIMHAPAIVKQAAIGRVHTSTASSSPSMLVGVSVEYTSLTSAFMKLWTAPDLDTPFVYQSRIDETDIRPVPIWNWEFGFTNYLDHTPATPRMEGKEFDFWMVGDFGGGSAAGSTSRYTGYRTTATLSGGIFAPRGGFRTASGAHYVTMSGGGVNATSTSLGYNQRFVIIDENSGSLNSGETVALMAPNGLYLSNGGGTAISLAPSIRTNERYVIEKKNAGSSQIVNGDTIALRAVSNSKYLIAATGGGSTVTNAGLVTNPNTHFVFIAN